MTTTSTITTTGPSDGAVVSNTNTVEIITDVFNSTPRSSYEDVTRNSSNKFGKVDLKIHRQKVELAIFIGIAVGGVVLVVLSASILCFLRKRKARAPKKIGIQTGNVENINYMYLSDTREEVCGIVRYTNSPVDEIVCIPGETRIGFHGQDVDSKSDHGTIGCKDTDDYNRIYFSGKPIFLDPTYNRTESALAETRTRLYNATENSASKNPYLLDTEYNHKFVSRDNANDFNTCSDASENIIVDDSTYDNLGNIQTINVQSQAAARRQTSIMNKNICDNDTSINDSELNIYVNVNFNQNNE
ncbi:hypothetical protein CHS0354_013532 [Potamilus streckersoni]|nr:hypothetical protein CHS0354_013532 [Potamilus streckersoni]